MLIADPTILQFHLSPWARTVVLLLLLGATETWAPAHTSLRADCESNNNQQRSHTHRRYMPSPTVARIKIECGQEGSADGVGSHGKYETTAAEQGEKGVGFS